jgi:restriction system protein
VPIPTFDKMLDPLLALAGKEPLTRVKATEAMEQHFNLTKDERTARIPSGQSTFVRSRAGWAMTFLTKAGLIHKVAPKTYRGTDKGASFRAEHPKGITLQDLRAIEGWDEAWQSPKSKRSATGHTFPIAAETGTSTVTPGEALDGALRTLDSDLKSRLLDAILAQTPEFFERLVLDVC